MIIDNIVDRKLQDAEGQNRDLMTNLAKREEALHQNSVSL